MDKDKAIDIFGIKPVGEALNTTVTKSFEAVEGFLKIVCVPALEEIGLLLKDKVRNWRLNNILQILNKAQGQLEFSNEQLQIKAHPRVALSIIENGSLIDNDEVQDLWAGLFISSCTKNGQDDENLIFVDILKQLTVLEAKILKYACKNARKIYYPNYGLFIGDKLEINCEELYKITDTKDINRLDRELDHMRSLELIGTALNGGFFSTDMQLIADISPTALALNLYLKSQGHNDEPEKYWTDDFITIEEFDKEKEELEKEKLEKIKSKTEKK